LLLGGRIVVMRAGRIEQCAAPVDILAHPASDYVRDLFAIDDAVSQLREKARDR
jgi:ABC-type proline/glycine betaine transport system ATPase subunit